MKTFIGTGVVGLALLFSGAAMADNPNWSPEKAAQIAVNRCANAGLGNGKEVTGTTIDPVTEEVIGGGCEKGVEGSENPDWESPSDLDPGNSGKNANNRKPPK